MPTIAREGWLLADTLTIVAAVFAVLRSRTVATETHEGIPDPDESASRARING